MRNLLSSLAIVLPLALAGCPTEIAGSGPDSPSRSGEFAVDCVDPETGELDPDCLEAVIAARRQQEEAERADDIDLDGIPNEDDPDVDGDGQPNRYDFDVDGDGKPNGHDEDTDGDGVSGDADPDEDGDGLSDRFDLDDDGDGLFDDEDADDDGDGLSDRSDLDDDGDSHSGGHDEEEEEKDEEEEEDEEEESSDESVSEQNHSEHSHSEHSHSEHENQNNGNQNNGEQNNGNQNNGDQNNGDQNNGDQNNGDQNNGNQNPNIPPPPPGPPPPWDDPPPPPHLAEGGEEGIDHFVRLLEQREDMNDPLDDVVPQLRNDPPTDQDRVRIATEIADRLPGVALPFLLEVEDRLLLRSFNPLRAPGFNENDEAPQFRALHAIDALYGQLGMALAMARRDAQIAVEVPLSPEARERAAQELTVRVESLDTLSSGFTRLSIPNLGKWLNGVRPSLPSALSTRDFVKRMVELQARPRNSEIEVEQLTQYFHGAILLGKAFPRTPGAQLANAIDIMNGLLPPEDALLALDEMATRGRDGTSFQDALEATVANHDDNDNDNDSDNDDGDGDNDDDGNDGGGNDGDGGDNS